MNEYCVAFWNVENLFDVVDSNRRPDKLRRTLEGELDGWTSDVLERKIHQLSSIIRQMNRERGPDLLGLCEVENEHVLGLLVNALAPLGRNYGIVHFDTQDKRGIDVAFIYDQNLLTAEDRFSHFIVKRTATRDLLHVNFRTSTGNLLVAIGNHWPSRTGGQWETEPYRIVAGETLAYFHTRIREVHDEDVAVLALGDFNDEPHNRAIADYALGERSKEKVKRAESAKFLNVMWPVLGQGIGTHYYDNIANVFDQFLISKGLLTGKSGFTALLESVEVITPDEMTRSGAYPCPIRFGRKSSKNLNMDGYSDHFPISLILREG